MGNNIKAIRKSKHISLKNFKDDWFDIIDSSTILNWEKGIDLPPIEDLDYMANIVLDVSLEYLLSGKEKEEWDGWSYADAKAEAQEYIDGPLFFDELSEEAKEYCYQNGLADPSDECDEYEEGRRDFSKLSKEARKIAYRRDPENEIKGYYLGDLKYSELSSEAKYILDTEEIDDEEVEEDIDEETREVEKPKSKEDLSDDELFELFQDGEIELSDLTGRARKLAIYSLTCEEQYDLYIRGEIGFSEMSPDATTWFFEEMDDDEEDDD